MWALIDNYDSFTYMLWHYLQALHPDVKVWKNDAISAKELSLQNPERIILSPGPCRPEYAGNMMEIIRSFYRQKPILGICLGHQALGTFWGARLSYAVRPFHGKTSAVMHEGKAVFKDLPNPVQVMRYHSLLLEDWDETIIEPLAFTAEKELMAFRHRQYPCTGIQFHPESVKTEFGMQMLRNWSDDLL